MFYPFFKASKFHLVDQVKDTFVLQFYALTNPLLHTLTTSSAARESIHFVKCKH